jgi:hypothetical protein
MDGYIKFLKRKDPLPKMYMYDNNTQMVTYDEVVFDTALTQNDKEFIFRINNSLERYRFINCSDPKFLILGINPYKALLKYQANDSDYGIHLDYNNYQGIELILDDSEQDTIKCLKNNSESFKDFLFKKGN